MKSIGEQHIKVYQFHFKYSGSSAKLKSRRNYIMYTVYWYSWLGFGNHTVRWRGIQSCQVIKTTESPNLANKTGLAKG